MVKSIKRNNFLSAMKGVVITFVLMMTFILKVQNATTYQNAYGAGEIYY
ncbi:MAG: hypothetical protein IJA32_10665 [Lachnospiraceae bacterium]|nr:hypothetical protein [Lachnospiraceae bacterium]